MFIEDLYKTNTCRVLVYSQNSWYSNARILDVEQLFLCAYMLHAFPPAVCYYTTHIRWLPLTQCIDLIVCISAANEGCVYL